MRTEGNDSEPGCFLMLAQLAFLAATLLVLVHIIGSGAEWAKRVDARLDALEKRDDR